MGHLVVYLDALTIECFRTQAALLIKQLLVTGRVEGLVVLFNELQFQEWFLTEIAGQAALVPGGVESS